MGRHAIEKGKEYRPRLHDGLEAISQIGRFIVIKLKSESEAVTVEGEAKSGIYTRPNRSKGPKRIA